MRLVPGMPLTDELRLVRALRRGAMGEVWIGESDLWGQVAVKFLSGSLDLDPAAVQRFEREWKMASDIDSPYTVRMLDMGYLERRPYIVMELLEGETLQDMIDREGKLPPRLVVKLLEQVAEALDAAHARGIVHRDIKPENILLVDDGAGVMVKVLDFGLAKPWVGGHTLTQTGLVMGTPYFMSPEQVSGGGSGIDHRADLWALAAVAYRLLSGALPFEAPALHALVYEILKGSYTPIEARGGPAELAPWFARAFSGPREERFDSAGEMIAELGALLGLRAPRSDEVTAEVTLFDPSPATHQVPELDTTQVYHDLPRSPAAVSSSNSFEVDTQPVPVGPTSSGRGPDSITRVRALPVDPIAETLLAEDADEAIAKLRPLVSSSSDDSHLVTLLKDPPVSSEPATRPVVTLVQSDREPFVAPPPLPYAHDDAPPTVDMPAPLDATVNDYPSSHPPPPAQRRDSYPSVPPEVADALSALDGRHPPRASGAPPATTPLSHSAGPKTLLFVAALAVVAAGAVMTWRLFVPPEAPAPHAAPSTPARATTATHSAVALVPAPPPRAASATTAAASATAADSATAATSADPPAPLDERAAAAAAANMALLTVRCTPACIVLLNGRKFGVSPIKEQPIGVGKHRITAYRDDTGGKTYEADLSPGERYALDVKMR